MTLIEQIRTKLAADTTVNGIVAGRMFPNVMPQATTLPAIVLVVVSDVPQNSLDGASSTRMKQARVQIDCYARASGGVGAYAGAHALADAVEAVVSNLNDPNLSAWLEATRDLYDDATEYQRVSMDFSVWH